MNDPFAQIEPPADKDAFVKLAWLACMARENEIQFKVVHDWVLPMASLPWTPRTARTLRQAAYHVERVRGCLQANAECFPTMSRDDAQAWAQDLVRHHGGSFPSWWSKGVVAVAEQIFNLARRN